MWDLGIYDNKFHYSILRDCAWKSPNAFDRLCIIQFGCANGGKISIQFCLLAPLSSSSNTYDNTLINLNHYFNIYEWPTLCYWLLRFVSKTCRVTFCTSEANHSRRFQSRSGAREVVCNAKIPSDPNSSKYDLYKKIRKFVKKDAN